MDNTYACPHNGEPGICRRTRSFEGETRSDRCGAKHHHRIEQAFPGRCPDHEAQLVRVTK